MTSPALIAEAVAGLRQRQRQLEEFGRRNGGVDRAATAFLDGMICALLAMGRQTPTNLDLPGRDSEGGVDVPLLLDFDDVAALLRVSRRTVERRVARKEIPTVRVGGCVRVDRRALDLYLTAKSPDLGATA
jgi:excisionase family DNA binding protein